jgi:hypothetical protein
MRSLRLKTCSGVAAAALLSLGLGACDEGRSTPAASGTAPSSKTGTTTTPSPTSGTTTSTPAPVTPDATNTGRNERDRNSAAPTPPDQGETEADRKITAEIRRAVIATQGMSTNGQNCKIITRGGTVTLRGPVASQAERDQIGAAAKAVAGVTTVVNELEVAR